MLSDAPPLLHVAVMNAKQHLQADAALGRGDVLGAIAALERSLLEEPRDFAGWMKLTAMRRQAGQTEAALVAVNAALDLRPTEFLAMLLKGGLLEQLGQTIGAAELYRATLFHAPAIATLPPPVAMRLDRVRAFLAHHHATVESRLRAMTQLDAEHAARSHRFADNVLERRDVYHQEPTHYRYPGLPDVEFFDFAYPDLRQRLADAVDDISAELAALLERHGDRQRPYVDFAAGEPVGQWAGLNRSPDWNALHLIRYGDDDPVNATACPRTMAAFGGQEQARIPGLGPNLMFSLLAAHAHIPPHHGVANFRAVCHVPLVVPRGCRFRVGADTREWKVGEPWIFDDTIEHEAWNDSEQLRVVLIGDVWRPELDDQDRTIVCDLMQAQEGSQSQRLGAL